MPDDKIPSHQDVARTRRVFGRHIPGLAEEMEGERLDAKERADLLTKQQKDHNDRAMVRITLFGALVSVIAAASGAWASFEAHKSRIEAGEIGRQSIEKQSQAVNAQILAMENDERPFLRTEFGGMATVSWMGVVDDPTRLQGDIPTPHVRVLAFGRTPAIEVQSQSTCVRVRPADSLPEFNKNYEGDWQQATIFPNESEIFGCDSRVDPPRPDERYTRIIFEGIIRYKSISGHHYETPFCYERNNDGKIKNCSSDNPT